jgi:hypothetical protein
MSVLLAGLMPYLLGAGALLAALFGAKFGVKVIQHNAATKATDAQVKRQEEIDVLTRKAAESSRVVADREVAVAPEQSVADELLRHPRV